MSLSQSDLRNRILASIPAEEFDVMRTFLDVRDVMLGEVLIAPHEPIATIVFPDTAVFSLLSPTATEIEVALIGREGALAPPLALGLDALPFLARVQMAGRIVTLSTEVALGLFRRTPRLHQLFGRFAHVVMAQAGSTAYANARMTVEQRLARWLLMAHDRVDTDELAVTHEFLAGMLAVRRPGVTVATHILEGKRAIRASRGRITIVSRPVLARFAGDAYGYAEAEYDRVMG